MLGSPAGERTREETKAVKGLLRHLETERLRYFVFRAKADKQTTWRCLSFSVLWLYQGSSRSGDHCQAYFRTVLITALLIKMHRYTMRKAFIDLHRERERVKVRRRTQGL